MSDATDPRAVARVVGAAVGAAAGVVAVQGLAVVGLALGYAVQIVAGTPHNRGLALFGAAIGLGFGGTLLVAARGLRRGMRAAYSPILLIEIIAVPVGIGLVQGHQSLLALAVLGPAVGVVGVLLGTPGGRAVLSEGVVEADPDD